MTLKFLADRDNIYVYPWYFLDVTATKDIGDIIGMKVEKTFVIIREDFMSMWYDYESSKEIGKKLLEKLLNERDFYETIKKNIYLYAEELLAYCESVQTNLDRKSDQEL